VRHAARPQAPDAGPPRAAPRSAWQAAAPFVTAVVGVALGALVNFRAGAGLVGLAALTAAVLRGVRGPAAGMLVVRSRWFDVLVAGALGVGLVVLAGTVPDR